jgi:uncharacterized membrane protein YvbJ
MQGVGIAMKYCAMCGTKSEDIAKFCVKCGYRFKEVLDDEQVIVQNENIQQKQEIISEEIRIMKK